MSAVEEYQKWRGHNFPDAVNLRAVLKKADTAIAAETARADRAEALLRYVLMQDMEHGDRGREPLDGLIERLGALMDAEVKP